jgi:UDP-glucose 4-epimerase
VCDEFLKQGDEVFALDNLSSGRKENLDGRVRLLTLDIRSPETAQWIGRERPEVICHLAAQMDVRKSVEDPRFDAEANILGFLNILEAAQKAKVKKVVFSSTGGAIYGEQDQYPATESHATRPVSPYGVSKASGELYLGYYRAQYGLAFTSLRYANVYGPRQNPHGEAGVVAIFSQRLAEGKPCTIFGTGKQTRDFVFGPEVAVANVLAARSDFVGALNIGTGIETDVATLYQLLADAAGSKLAAQLAPGKPGEQARSCIDASEAKRVLGWQPKVGLKEGLRQTLEYFRNGASSPRTKAIG